MTAPLSLTRPVDEAADPRRVALALVAVYLIWGSTYLAMRWAVAGLPPFFMAGWRFVLSGAVLFGVLKLRGAPWPSRREWLAGAPVGLLMFAVGNGLVVVAEQHLGSAVSAVVIGTMPLWTAALALLFGEQVTGREWLALVLGFVGVGVLATGGELAAEPGSTLVLCLAPVGWALGSHLARRLPMARGLMAPATQMLVGGVAMVGVSLLLGERVTRPVPAPALWAWLYLAVAGSLVAYSAYSWLLRHTRPAVATSYAYVNPVVAVALGALVGGERVGPELFLAVALILAATGLVMLRRR
jgi:drug/metabolite transporter (DMT)-like permease